MTALIVPALLCAVGIWALSQRVDVFSALVDGAREGMKISAGMLPALVVLLSGIYALRASGALDALCALLAPVLALLGIPEEIASVLIVRPLSGSGALAAGSELISRFGPDSHIGRCTAVMLGSTETTFYVIAVYFGAAGIRKTRRAVPAALCADLCGFVMAALTVRIFFG